MPSLKHPKWIKKKQVTQLCPTPHLVCNIMVKLKVCLFISYFYVSLNSENPCSIWCTLFMYIFKKKNSKKKKFKIPKSFLKKEKNFQIKKNLWTRGIEPLSHLKKKNLWTRGIGLPSEFFSKKTHFFSFKDFKIL